MPTLLEKTTEVSPANLPVRVLHSRHRWERWRGILFTFLVGLTATLAVLWTIHPSWHPPEGGKVIALIWIGGVGLTALVAGIWWWFAPASLSDTAQGMDRHLASKNRFEAAALLHGSDSPLALAQREETAAYLKEVPYVRPVRGLAWLTGVVTALLIAHLLTFSVWVVPMLLRPAPPKPPPPVKALPQATIVWQSPEPESKANQIEEVPTIAEAQSTTGLRGLSLEVSVNGMPKKSVKLPVQPYDHAGKNTIKVSLYMDELEVQPFDTVSYYIRGQRVTDQKVPDTVSAIQFIEVRPLRDDVVLLPEGSPHKGYNLIIRLKLAQLKALKENFVLAHTDLPVTHPVRMQENERVGKNQGDLSAKTEEVVQAFITEGVSPDIIDLLRQAEPHMDDASKKILATKNMEAIPSQEKALSLIIEVEKFVQKEMVKHMKSGPSSANPPDPFKDKQKHEMKQRVDSSAGHLEQLAKNQEKLSRDMDGPSMPGGSPVQPKGVPSPSSEKPTPAPSGPSGNQPSPPQPSPASATGNDPQMPAPQAVDPFVPDDGKGTLAERQARVLQGVGTLLNTNEVLPPPVQEALKDAQKDATQSIHRLDQGDTEGAREPASLAAKDLQRAVAEMNKAGEEQTKTQMAEAQQKLNDLARQLDDLKKNGAPNAPQQLADAAAKLKDLQQHLEHAADHQQEAGSAKGAQRLNQLAKGIEDQKVEQDLRDMAQKGPDASKLGADVQKLQALAGQAAQGLSAGQPSARDISELLTALEKSRANLARLAQKAGGNTPGQPPGQQPGEGQKPGQAAGQQPGQQPSPGQGATPQPTPGQGQGKGEGEGQGQGPKPGQQGQGEGQGQQPGAEPGQGQGGGGGGDGQGDGMGEGPGHGNQLAHQPNSQSPQPNNQNSDHHGSSASSDGQNGEGLSTNPLKSSGPGVGSAYHDVMAELRDQVQRATVVVPTAHTEPLAHQLDTVTNPDPNFRKTSPIDVIAAYQAIAPPLDQLIAEVEKLVHHAQREDIVRQPNLDEAPPSYRPAVSEYFEEMSRDYKPDEGVAPGADAPKPQPASDPKKP